MTIQRPGCMKTLRQGSVSISLSRAARSCGGPRPASGVSGYRDPAGGHQVGAVAFTESDRFLGTLRADHLRRSCLYWAWWRRNRTTADLSHGWGANSPWGTDFRRDYIVGGQLHYNVDGYKNQPSASDGDLSGAAAWELLRQRCSTRDDLGKDRWPWHLTLTEPAP